MESINWTDLIVAFPLAVALAWVLWKVFTAVFEDYKKIREQSNEREVDTINALNNVTKALEINANAIDKLSEKLDSK